MRRLEEERSRGLPDPSESPTATQPPAPGPAARPEPGEGQAPAPQAGFEPPLASGAADAIDAPLPRELAEQILRAVEERERGLQREKLRKQRQRVRGPDW